MYRHFHTKSWSELDENSQNQEAVESIWERLCQRGDYHLGIKKNKLCYLLVVE